MNYETIYKVLMTIVEDKYQASIDYKIYKKEEKAC